MALIDLHWHPNALGPSEKGTIGENGWRTQGVSSASCDPSHITCYPVIHSVPFMCVWYQALSPHPGHKRWARVVSLCPPEPVSVDVTH